MIGQDPFGVMMFLGETFGQYLVRVTMAMTLHVTASNYPFHNPTTRAHCLLNGLPEEELCPYFRQKCQNFIETREVREYANHFSVKKNLWMCIL